MRIKLIYPRWRKLERQTHFNLPPHGPVVFAASLPSYVDIEFIDENVDPLDLDDSPDIVALSVMLAAQIPRAFEIGDHYRRRRIPVIAGGISASLHSEEFVQHVDSIFIGESEGHIEKVLEDFRNGRLAPLYDYSGDLPNIEWVGPARRDLLNNEHYMYRGIKMLDLVHASRGCRFKCFPCCTPFLGGQFFRPRPLSKVVEEIKSIDNNRLFIVDNSLAQNYQWEEELFKALIPLKKKWVSHPIEDDDRLLDLAYQAGAWYVYQAVFDTSEVIRNRVKRYKDHGIGVEGTIILGTDNQDIDYIKRLVDFLLEIDLDVAEFTILTPFMHTPIRAKLEKEGRILSNNWADYTCDKVVFQPKNMTNTQLQDIYYYAWDTFYKNRPQELKMGDLFMKVIHREIADGTYKSSPKPKDYVRHTRQR
ncbi:MAG: radical SAM protein [Nitrospirae bacterium RIFCSPLOW2_12_42_9]|nr:MAG: radical SAM protein [Nitrospirae bacterium RIFCSPLOW2_12_42_9]OGW58516.1 MAG: radical SAM protein [Nitrospirae bacterium RIFCSPHIGHO2_02_FULL_42_12]HAS17663.1 radical SAM protein [Nitrospiraceae bacterium]HBI24057.1 radical SAM protein [Nitrospiraceae bacterium]